MEKTPMSFATLDKTVGRAQGWREQTKLLKDRLKSSDFNREYGVPENACVFGVLVARSRMTQNGKTEPEGVQMYIERFCFFIAQNIQ